MNEGYADQAVRTDAPPKHTTVVTALDDLLKVSAALTDIINQGDAIASQIGGSVGRKGQPEAPPSPQVEPVKTRLNEIASRIRRQVSDVDQIFQHIGASLG